MSKPNKSLAVVTDEESEFSIYMAKEIVKLTKICKEAFRLAKEEANGNGDDEERIENHYTMIRDVMRKKIGETLSRKYHDKFFPKPDPKPELESEEQ